MVIYIAEMSASKIGWVALRKWSTCFEVMVEDKINDNLDTRTYKTKTQALRRFKDVVGRLVSQAMKEVE